MNKYLLKHCTLTALRMIEAEGRGDLDAWRGAWTAVERDDQVAQLTLYLLAITICNAPPRPFGAYGLLVHERLILTAYPSGIGYFDFDAAHRFIAAAKTAGRNPEEWRTEWKRYPWKDSNDGQTTARTMTAMVFTAWDAVTGSRKASIRRIRRDLNSLGWMRMLRQARNAYRCRLRHERQREGVNGTYDYPAIPDLDYHPIASNDPSDAAMEPPPR